MRRGRSSGFGEVLAYVDLHSDELSFTSSLQLVICAIPVFFKIPGAEHFDLGSRTEGDVVRAIFV